MDMKWICAGMLAVASAACLSCGGRGTAEAAPAGGSEPRVTYNKILGVRNYQRTFNDVNDVHLSAAVAKGITPLENREEAVSAKERLLRIAPNGFYAMDSLTHSIPYLVPSASVLLTKIGSNFQDSLAAKGLPESRIIVTSVLRTKHDARRLSHRNVNATLNSAHFYGTTFDISYRRFEPADTAAAAADPWKLKMVLAEVLRDLRKKEWCYVKYEVKQGCFHVTTRL